MMTRPGRSPVGRRSALPLATRKLIITPSQLGADAGIIGAIALAGREVFSQAGVGRLLAEV